MELQIKIDELRKRKLFVGLPCYAGQMMGMCAKSCLDLQGMFQQMGIEIRFSFLFNESLITRARNYLSDEFLRSKSGPEGKETPFTDLLFIDSDIHFDPRDIITLLVMDKDIVGGPYPKKSLKWPAIKEAIQRHPQIPPDEFSKLIGDFVFNPIAGTTTFNVTEPISVMEIGTGYMMIKRRVFELMAQQYPEMYYKPDHVGQANFDGSRYINAFFDCIIDRKRSITIVNDLGKCRKDDVIQVGGSDRYLSEDYRFCQAWRNMGGEIWLCPWMLTTHLGTYGFQGNLPAIANLLGKL